MRDEFWLEDQSPDLFDIADDQTPDSFRAFSGVLRGEPGPPGPQGPPGADGTVSFDELTPAQRESLRGEGVPAGGTAGQVLAKASNTDYATGWVDAGMVVLSYGSSTWADFLAAYNAKKIVYCHAPTGRMAVMAYVNHPTDVTRVDFVYYYQTTHTDAQQGDQIYVYTLTQSNGWSAAVKNTFSTIAAGDGLSSTYSDGTLTLSADNLVKPNEIGIVITGKRPSTTVTAGQYVIVRNSTISNISDGLYTANAALSPSTDVTAANLTAVSGGGLNSVAPVFSIETTTFSTQEVDAGAQVSWNESIARAGKKPVAIVALSTNRTNVYIIGFSLSPTNQTAFLAGKNTSSSAITASGAYVQVLYINN